MIKTLPFPSISQLHDAGRGVVFGFPIWLAFLLSLEPGNLARASAVGQPLDLSGEAIRILGASLLGGASTPLILMIVRRFPVERNGGWLNLGLQIGASAALGLALIVASCLLAWVFNVGDARPVLAALPDEINDNWLLVSFCLATVTAMAHAFKASAGGDDAATQAVLPAVGVEPAFLHSVMIKSRGRAMPVALRDVAWIETQGNYLALHTESGAHLLRETLQGFEAKLDPAAFVRIHRRMLVALDRVKEVATEDGGEACARLSCGTRLRVSRSYREKLNQALASRSR